MPNFVWFDEKLQYYTKMIVEVSEIPLSKVQNCILIHTDQLSSAICNHIQMWIDLLGKSLRDSAKTQLIHLRDRLYVSKAIENFNNIQDRMIM